ncbi:MAG: type II toxin-antitoxin system VapC family toxin [Planctomycetaceae bacterium]|nr:type II toxin-antitoxin system VapC family toxin [Planctomycetaceae bacterium]
MSRSPAGIPPCDERRHPSVSRRPNDRLARTVVFLSQFPILSFSVEAISEYDRLPRNKLGVRANDLRIAAIALNNDDIVVTRNVTDFSRVPGLRVENWAD